MLTIATITPQQGEQYYQKENYYTPGDAQQNSEWLGRGAARLGLRGAIVNNEAYRNLVHGLSPDGTQALRQKPKQLQNPKPGQRQPQERAGVDLTFSAPKSVSLACLVGGDQRLEAAHRQAVKRTLTLIEQRYPQTRVKGERVATDNLTVALWHHDTSRELDPHLHTHCVVMNLTQRSDGQWQSRTDENLLYNKILLGQLYRQELALECRKLGYEIERHPQELFEIKGYSREQIEKFSKRHDQILSKLAEVGEEATTENKIWAWRKTRVKKNHALERTEMLPQWQQEAELYGISHPMPAPVPQIPSPEAVQAELQATVAAGIEHCSERRVAFQREELEKFVTAEIRPFSVTELEQALQGHPDLLKTYDQRYTTQAALRQELATIRLMQQGKGQVGAIASPEVVASYLEGKVLTEGQQEAVTLTATTTDQFIAWQGVAGAGKTFALKELKQIVESLSGTTGYTLQGFAPSAEAAKVLGEELGIETQTVARLLLTPQPDHFQPQQLWIVDEAGLLSAKDAYALLQRATAAEARVILVGDVRQLSAVEAGNPFKSLQQAGIQTAYLNQSLRQKPQDLQKAVNLAAAGRMGEAIAHLDQVNRMTEIPEVTDRAAQIAHDYLALTPEARQQTLILAGTHKERSTITQQIRQGLQQEGTLGPSVAAARLKAKDLTQVQARYAHHYQVGEVVVPTREYRRSGLHKGQPYVVEAINQDLLTLRNWDGDRLTIDPMQFRKTVYTREALDLAVGDLLRWTRNDTTLGRRNGQEFRITAIADHIATIEYRNGKTDSLNLLEPLHLDHALVATTYSSQGKTAERVLMAVSCDRTVSQESIYVAISRAKQDLKLYVEDKQEFLDQAQVSQAQENPQELLPLHPSQAQPAAAIPELEISFPSSTHASVASQTVAATLELPQEQPQQLQRVGDRFSTAPQHFRRTITDLLRRKTLSLAQTLSNSLTPPALPADQVVQQLRPLQEITVIMQTSSKPLTPPQVEPGTPPARQMQDFLAEVEPELPPQQRDRPRQPSPQPQLTLTEMAQQVRDLPLETVAERLGLERDRYDHHKWRSPGHVISITGQKFYDHLHLTGGGGAIDLVMHLQQQSYREAVSWLYGQAPPVPRTQVPPRPAPQPPTPQPFEPPNPDATRWPAVRQYLIQQRRLPVALVDQLHRQGKIYASGLTAEVLAKLQNHGRNGESLTNAVFLRENLDGEVTGAFLRGIQSDFKGLATGSSRDQGWFMLSPSAGEVKRTVLVESGIDALSLAALEPEQSGTTLYIATDGAGAIPQKLLQKQMDVGCEIVLGFDRDRAGEEMAWKAAQVVPTAHRLTPTWKDWNDQLRHPGLAPELDLDLKDWQRVAKALGKSTTYVEGVDAIAQTALPGQQLTPTIQAMMQQDFSEYQATLKKLWQWHETARALGKSQAYLHRIAEVAIGFNAAKAPQPLTPEAQATMQKDLGHHVQTQQIYMTEPSPQMLWQKYSQIAVGKIKELKLENMARLALREGHPTQTIVQMLMLDPYFQATQRKIGLEKTLRLAEGAVKCARAKEQPQRQKQQQRNQQKLRSHQPELD